VIDEEERVENLDEGGYHSLGKIFQSPVRDTIWAQGLADLKTPDVFLIIVSGFQLRFAGRGQEVRPQQHVNHLDACRERRNGRWLKLNLQTVGKGFRFLRRL
jgi:hypothetical protein